MGSILTPRPAWSLDDLRDAALGRTNALVLPHVADRVALELQIPQRRCVDALEEGLDSLVVVGGGHIIDEAKAWVGQCQQKPVLIAVPSIWGSGAEASPVAVLNRDGVKHILLDDALIPRHRVIWPELASTVSVARVRAACADCWAHAIEGFLSPLARNDVRRELALTMRDMLALPLANDARWFEASARACLGQARASAGLIHGIAHTLEFPLQASNPAGPWHHAKLCQVFLLPVMSLNLAESAKAGALFEEYGVNVADVLKVMGALFDCDKFASVKNILAELWPRVLRDRSTRTNCVLVKSSHVAYLTDMAWV